MNLTNFNTKSRKQLYSALRGEMALRSLTQEDVAKITDRSDSYVQRRFAGHLPWDFQDAFNIIESFDLSAADIPRLFPKGGRS